MKCWSKNCKNEALKDKHYCSTCRTRKYRERHPLKYIYDTIKMNAKRRGKVFTLTFNQFKSFCEKTGYDKFKGRTAECLSIDRIRPWEGYTFENIQAITVHDNIIKKYEDDQEFKKIDTCPF